MAERLHRVRSVSKYSERSTSTDTADESDLQLSTTRATCADLDIGVDSQPQAQPTTTATTHSRAGPSHTNSIRHHSNRSQQTEQNKPSGKKPSVIIEVLAPKPAVSQSRRQRILPRPDMDDYTYSTGVSERDRYRRPEGNYMSPYVGPGAQAVPYQPNLLGQNLPYGYPPADQARYPTHSTQSSNFGTTAPLPPQVLARPEPEKLAIIQEELDRVVRELHSLKVERERKQERRPREEVEPYSQGQHHLGPRHSKGNRLENSKQRELESLLEQLQAEKERSRKLEIEKEAIQSQAILEAENDMKRRALEDLAAVEEHQRREDEVRKETERVILARVEAEKKAQEELQSARLEQLQKMMESLGNQVSMMEKKEADRLAEEQKEADRLAEEQKEEERRKQDNVRQMEQYALQRMRYEKARKERAEAESLAEEERLKLEQELQDKERIENEIRETIRTQEEERVREERKRQEQERLLGQTLEDSKRQEANSRAADEETRRRIDEMVKQSLEEKLRSENERLHHDLRRHTSGTLAGLQINHVQRHQRPRILLGNQHPVLPEPATELPASNPFSRNRSRIPARYHPRESHSSQESYQFVSQREHQFFGELQQPNDWASDEQPHTPLHRGKYRPPQDFLYTDDESTASSTPQTPRNMSHRNRGYESHINIAGWSPQNPYREKEYQRQIPEQASRTWSDPKPLFQHYHNEAQSLADISGNEDAQSSASFPEDFTNDNGSHVMQGERSHASDGYVTARGGASDQSLESPTQPIHTPPSSSVLENSGHLTEMEHQSQLDQSRHESNNNTGGDRESKGEARVITDSGVMGSGYTVDKILLEGQRIQNQPKQMQPSPPGPPAPTPPQSIPPQPTGWQNHRGTPLFNNRRPAYGEISGFPPSFTHHKSPQGSQHLQLSTNSGMMSNVPYIMVPLIPGYPIQFSSPAQQAIAPQTEVGDGPRT